MQLGMSPEIVSVVALVVALSSTTISYLVLRQYLDPLVVVYAVADPTRPSIISLIIENIGNGIADDITFESNRTIPTRAYGFENAPMPPTMKDGPLIHGIPSLVRLERREMTWGQFGGLHAGLGGDVLEISATYFSRAPLSLIRTKHRHTSRIDIRSFEGTDASDHNWDKKTAESLKKIAAALERVVDPHTNSLRITELHRDSVD
jgi:hypothetical protein